MTSETQETKAGWYVELERDLEIGDENIRASIKKSGPHANYRAAYKASKELPRNECYRIVKDHCGVRHKEVAGVESERLP